MPPSEPSSEPSAPPSSRPFSRETSLGYQVNYLARLLAQALHDRIARLGVVPGQFAQLLTLYAENGLTQRELCERVGIEQPTMANTLQRMERDGLVRRVADPADGRRALVLLTDRARDLEGPLVAAAQDVNAVATAGFDDREVATLLHAVHRVIANLETEAGARPPRP